MPQGIFVERALFCVLCVFVRAGEPEHSVGSATPTELTKMPSAPVAVPTSTLPDTSAGPNYSKRADACDGENEEFVLRKVEELLGGYTKYFFGAHFAAQRAWSATAI